VSDAIVTSAPGKLLIAGEYAVLEGAPAISLAVDRRASVRIGEADECSLVVIAANESRYPFSWQSDGTVDYPDVDPQDRGTLLKAALRCLTGMLPDQMPSVEICIDSSRFFSNPEPVKLGLGSSAAVCVALTGALTKCLGIQTDVHRLALEVHHEFQQKSGSGADVMTSLQGGLISYRRGTATEPATQASLNWPQGLQMVPVWTGVAASTTGFVARFNDHLKASPAAVDPLKAAAESLLDIWSHQNASEVLDQLALYARRLKDFDREAGIGIYSGVHVEFQKKAAALGAVYKPSGAGGGDFGLVFTDSSASLELLSAEFEDAIVFSDWSATAQGLNYG